MIATTARALGALAIFLFAHGASTAQPAEVDWACTGWRQVMPTMLNPFGRECSQWTLMSQVKLGQIPPPPISVAPAQPAAAEAPKPKPAAAQKEKNRHRR